MIIPDSWKKLIGNSICLSNSCKFDVGSISPQIINGYQRPDDAFSYFAPNVFIWDPIRTSAGCGTLFCPEHGSPLSKTNAWMDGHDNSTMPRNLIDITGSELLVGRVYRCTAFGHSVRTTDLRILNNTPRYSADVVFSHKIVVKQQFLMSLFQQICNGLTFPRIYEILMERTMSSFYSNNQRYHLDCQIFGIEPDDNAVQNIREKLINLIPKKDALEDLFKWWFKENEESFTSSMTALSTNILTADHTFKVIVFCNLKMKKFSRNIFILG